MPCIEFYGLTDHDYMKIKRQQLDPTMIKLLGPENDAVSENIHGSGPQSCDGKWTKLPFIRIRCTDDEGPDGTIWGRKKVREVVGAMIAAGITQYDFEMIASDYYCFLPAEDIDGFMVVDKAFNGKEGEES